MFMSDKGLALLKSFEQCRLTPYKDIAGNWTIGWGHKINHFHGNMDSITQEQADNLLNNNLIQFQNAVNRYLGKTKVTQGEFDALVDLAYNIGPTALKETGILDLLVKGEKQKAAELILGTHININGKFSAGLARRRHAEYALFIS